LTLYKTAKLVLRKETKYFLLMNGYHESTEKQISEKLYEYLCEIKK